jgi:hypothetical protein
VLLMSRIYSSSMVTYVWLDSAGEIADKLLPANLVEWYRHFHNERPSATDGIWFDFDPKSLLGDDPEDSGPLKSALRKVFTSLLIYLKQPWFSRLWVYQEVLLSHKVWFLVGQLEMADLPWDYVLGALQHYDRLAPAELWDGVDVSVLGAAAPWCRRRIKDPKDQKRIFGYAPPSLTELLLETIPLKCLNPRDKIYALLGLTSWSTQRKTFPIELEPDYRLPTGDCMRNATLAAIGEGGSLDCLTLLVWTKQKPSWVVPWHELEVHRNRQPHLSTGKHLARFSLIPDCSRGRKVNLEILQRSNKPDSLFLGGNVFRTGWNILQVSNIVNPQDVEGLAFETKLREVIRSAGDLLAGQGLDCPDRLFPFLTMALWSQMLDF